MIFAFLFRVKIFCTGFCWGVAVREAFVEGKGISAWKREKYKFMTLREALFRAQLISEISRFNLGLPGAKLVNFSQHIDFQAKSLLSKPINRNRAKLWKIELWSGISHLSARFVARTCFWSMLMCWKRYQPEDPKRNKFHIDVQWGGIIKDNFSSDKVAILGTEERNVTKTFGINGISS